MSLLRSAICLVALLASNLAFATDYRSAGHFGIGLGGGTAGGGISGKYFFADAMAVQGVVGSWGGWGGGGLGLSADYLFEMPVLAKTEPLDIAWNIGPGVGVGLFPAADIVGIAASGVLGLELGFNPVPIDLVLEYRPTVLVVPTVAFDFVSFSGHIRWFF